MIEQIVSYMAERGSYYEYSLEQMRQVFEVGDTEHSNCDRITCLAQIRRLSQMNLTERQQYVLDQARIDLLYE